MNVSARRAPWVEAWSWLILAAVVYLSAWFVVEDALFGLWLFQGAFIAVGGLFAYWHLRTHGGDLLHPLVAMIVLLYLYATASALYVKEEGCTSLGFPAGAEILNRFYLCCILGLTGLVTGAWLARGGASSRGDAGPVQATWSVPDGECWIKLMVYGAVFALPALSTVLNQFNPANVQSYSETCFESRVAALDNPEQMVVGVLAAIPVQYLFSAAVLTVLRQRYWLFRAAAGVIVVLYLLVPLRGGFRGLVIGPVFLVLTVFHYRVKRIGPGAFAATVLLGYLFVTAMSIARQTSDLGTMVQLVRAEVQEGNGGSFSIRNSTEFWTGQNLMVLMHFMDAAETSFSYGKSLWNEILVFVPRALFADRPLSMAQQFAELVNPGATDAGMGYGFFILQEGYWICGVPGVFVSMLCLGWVLEKLYQWFMRRMSCDLVALAYGSLLGVCAASVRSGMILQLKAALMVLVPLVILGYLPSVKPAEASQTCCRVPAGRRAAPLSKL